MTNRATPSPAIHRQLFQKAWRAFWKEVRRCGALSQAQRRVRYIAIRECHKSGFVHVHALIDQYLPRSLLQPLWDGICARVLGLQGEPAGFLWVEFVPKDAHRLARYVVKYVTKSAQAFHQQFVKAHLWSRSAGVELELHRRPKQKGWSFVLDLRAATMPEITPPQPSPMALSPPEGIFS